MIPASNSLNFVELVVNELMKRIFKKLPIFFFLPDLSLLNVNISRAYNKRAIHLCRNTYRCSLLPVMSFDGSRSRSFR